jgi:hypothetical protein
MHSCEETRDETMKTLEGKVAVITGGAAKVNPDSVMRITKEEDLVWG